MKGRVVGVRATMQSIVDAAFAEYMSRDENKRAIMYHLGSIDLLSKTVLETFVILIRQP
jgi:hypothetical protein